MKAPIAVAKTAARMIFPVGEDAGWASAGVSACGSGIGVGLYRHLFSCPKEILKVGLPWSEEARVSEAQWIDRYLTGLLSERGLSANTVEGYRRDLAKLQAFLRMQGRETPAALSRADVPRLLEFLRSQGLASPSVARCLAACRGFYRFLLREGQLRQDPFLDVTVPNGSRRLPKALSVEDGDRKSTRLNSSHITISYAVFCLKKKIPPPAPSHSTS